MNETQIVFENIQIQLPNSRTLFLSLSLSISHSSKD